MRQVCIDDPDIGRRNPVKDIAHSGGVKRRRRLKKVFEVELLHGKRLGWTAELSRSARLVFGHGDGGELRSAARKKGVCAGGRKRPWRPTARCAPTLINM